MYRLDYKCRKIVLNSLEHEVTIPDYEFHLEKWVNSIFDIAEDISLKFNLNMLSHTAFPRRYVNIVILIIVTICK